MEPRTTESFPATANTQFEGLTGEEINLFRTKAQQLRLPSIQRVFARFYQQGNFTMCKLVLEGPYARRLQYGICKRNSDTDDMLFSRARLITLARALRDEAVEMMGLVEGEERKEVAP